jgi:methionyl-tRNA formyltransferase
MAPYGCLNVHASLLPAYRGAAPIQWAVLNGDKESGVTIMRMDEGLDTGDMISKVVVPLDEKETSETLFDKLSVEGAKLLVETLPKVASGEAVYVKQPELSPTPYAAMISKQMGEIDWSKEAKELERLVRGMNSWPSAYTLFRGKQLKIWEAEVVDEIQADAEPGTVIAVDKQSITVAAGEGGLQILELQIEGKKRMACKDFLLGYPVSVGEKLG